MNMRHELGFWDGREGSQEFQHKRESNTVCDLECYANDLFEGLQMASSLFHSDRSG
jgi:hypothetical protein